MRRSVSALIFCFLILISCSKPATSPPSPYGAFTSTTEELTKILHDRKIAAGKGNAEAHGRNVAENAILVGADASVITEAQERAEMKPSVAFTKSYEVQDLKIADFGDVAVLYYPETDVVQVGTQKLSFNYFYTDTYQRRNGKWQQIASVEMSVPLPRATNTVEPKLLDSYVGVYAATPQASFTVTHRGDKLYFQLTGQDAAEVLALNATTFYFPGDSSDLIFVKGPAGKVTKLLYRYSSQNIEYSRIE